MPRTIKHFWKEVDKHDNIDYIQCLFINWGSFPI